jgi:hypothetical protein
MRILVEENAYIQSIRPSFSCIEPPGVRTLKKNNTSKKEMPVRGRLRSRKG